MAFVRIGPLALLPPGAVSQVQVGEAAVVLCNVAVCNAEGEIHALHGICPHAGAPLGFGALHGKTLVCPWHAWEYDCETGVCDLDEDLKLAKYAVKVEDGEIFVDLTDARAT